MDLYSELGVSKDASPEEIKKSYRKLAQQNHPDKGGDSEKMQSIQKAYDVLSDAKKRDHYDQTGSAEGPADVRSMAIAYLTGLFLELLQGDMRGNVIDNAMGEVQERIGEVRRKIASQEKLIAKLEKNRQRVVNRNGGESIFTMVIENKLEQDNATLAQLRQLLSVLEEMVLIINEHEDTDPQVPNYMSPDAMREAMMEAMRSPQFRTFTTTTGT